MVLAMSSLYTDVSTRTVSEQNRHQVVEVSMSITWHAVGHNCCI